MSKMLLINPRRRKARKGRSAAQKRATAKMLSANRSRRRNPVARRAVTTAPAVRRRAARRLNPASRPVARRRRRNPISLGGVNVKSIMAAVKDAAIGAGGAVGIDLLMGRLNPMLPASLQRVPGSVGPGDAVKLLITILAGKLLAKPTKGLSVKMAQGALTVQAHSIVSQFLPAGLTLGYYSPAKVVQGQYRVGPNRARPNGQMAGYMKPGVTPLLSAYMAPGQSPLLSGNTNARERENVTRFR